jgi:acetyl-CoA acetyltransferase
MGSVLVLIVCGLLATGCGSSSSSSSSAVSKCKDAAKQISDSTARSIAEQACSSAGTAEKSISSAVSTAGQSATNAVSTAAQSVKSAAKQACLAGAQNAPAGTARDQAVAGCNKIK